MNKIIIKELFNSFIPKEYYKKIKINLKLLKFFLLKKLLKI